MTNLGDEMYDFDKVINRIGTGSVKWDKQGAFGVENGLLPFWIADTDFASPAEILEAMKKRCDHPIFGYSEAMDGCLEALCSWFRRRHQWDIKVGELVPGTGVVTSLRFCLEALTAPGDPVLVFSPVYDPFFAIINNTGRRLVDCGMVFKDNAYFMDFDLVEKHLKEGVKAVIFCNPHNPVARCWTRKELEQAAFLCEKYGVYVLSDEVHCDITLYGNRYTPMAAFGNIHERLISFTAISKTFNMAGLISSCMVIPNLSLRAKVAEAFGKAWIFGPGAIALTAMEAAYTHGDRYVDELITYLEGNAAHVADYFARNMPRVGVTKQEATFLMWLDFRCLGMGSDELTKLMAGTYKLALGNGVHYGTQADGFMRFNIGCPKSTLDHGLALINRLYTEAVQKRQILGQPL
jgi:cystathionine beta-lyase